MNFKENMKSNLMYHEVIELFEKQENKASRIAVLHKHADRNFVGFLCIALDPNVSFDVDIPDYRPSSDPAGLNILYLHNEVSKLYRFIKDHPRRAAGLSAEKQKSLLISLLEALHKDEADLLVRCIKKDLRVPFLTVKLVMEAFPGVEIGN
jgi:hypothetical protein